MDMRAYIKERSELAHTYACDGAYYSAARVLEELTKTVQQHADTVDEALNAAVRAKREHTVPLVSDKTDALTRSTWQSEDTERQWDHLNGNLRVMGSLRHLEKRWYILQRSSTGHWLEVRRRRFATAEAAMSAAEKLNH